MVLGSLSNCQLKHCLLQHFLDDNAKEKDYPSALPCLRNSLHEAWLDVGLHWSVK